MISSTIYSNGKDNFKDYVFSSGEWSATIMVSPEEIRKRIDNFDLLGRKIARMRIIGLSYCHTRDRVEEAAYHQLNHLPEDERQLKSKYQAIDSDMQFNRYVAIDEPLLIGFEDGDVFEIDTPQEPEFRMSMNCIPWWIGADTSQLNIDADILFAPCIGQMIISIEVNTYMTDKDPMFQDAFDEQPYQRELVSNITFRLENGIGLRIGTCIDYCEVGCINTNNEDIKISFFELKQALSNWEDLHDDEATGFEAKSDMLFFGRKGAEHTDRPYMTLFSSSRDDSRLHIYILDFLIIAWCISLNIGSEFDEYDEYHFSCIEWFGILDEANRLLSVKQFDTLFDELIDRQGKGGDIMYQLNTHGASFWKDREKYRTLVKDIYEWSELVLGQNDILEIYGF